MRRPDAPHGIDVQSLPQRRVTAAGSHRGSDPLVRLAGPRPTHHLGDHLRPVVAAALAAR
jgi:hypothetical protein